jgi:hypothetical protein
VADAARDAGVPLVAIDFWHVKPFAADQPDRTHFCLEIQQQIADGPVFSMIGGNAHHKLGLVVHPRPFDFVLPAAPHLPLDGRAEIVPSDSVRAALVRIAAEYLDLMRLLKHAVRGQVLHLQPPPIFADESRIAPDVPWMFFEGRRAVSPRYLRYKLWHLHSEIIQEFCRDIGILFIAHPPEAVDGDGFLLADYYANAMHVNSRYGALVLRQMREAA